MSKEEKILSDAFEAGFDRGEFLFSDSGHNCLERSAWVRNNLDDIREYAKERSIEFFKWYIMKGNNFLYYHREIKPLTTSKEIEEKIAEFEGRTIENLYTIFDKETNINSKSK